MALLNRKNLQEVQKEYYQSDLFDLPIKVLQFGTGVLLRALPDFFIDKANKAGVFNGRIAIVKSTSIGNIDNFKDQNYLYTHVLAGMQDGKIVHESIINTAIHSILHANKDWGHIVEIAENPETSVIISNTTEQGLVYVEEDILNQIPQSFPMRLLALLYARFQKIGQLPESEIVIIPTELIDHNGDLLKEFVQQGSKFNQVEADFETWLHEKVIFCNSLVDRIVPGKAKNEQLAFEDNFAIISEPFALWAIEGVVKKQLSFCELNPEVRIVDDITRFKELKLRLLNGTHILACGQAILSDVKTVKEGMGNPEFRKYIDDIVIDIKKAFLIDIDRRELDNYANQVMERFENPYIEHHWQSIILNYSVKMKIRVVPLLMNYFRKYGEIPESMLNGFVSYLLISIPNLEKEGKYFKEIKGKLIPLSDECSKTLFDSYQQFGLEKTIRNHLANRTFWEADFTTIPNFIDKIVEQVLKKIELNFLSPLPKA